MRIAIIGAGLSGLTLATRLATEHEIIVFEKARGPGGRMSTRRADPYAFDHGAQYFTAETEAFQRFLKPFLSNGTVAEWNTAIELKQGARLSGKTRYVGVPGMNALCKALAAPLQLQTGIHIERFELEHDTWTVIARDGQQYGPFDWVISTSPATQTRVLLPATFDGVSTLDDVKMSGCFALMLGFEIELDLRWTAMKAANSPIGWIAVNSRKPGRHTSTSLLIQSSNDWAESHLEDEPDDVTASLLKAASELTEIDLETASHKVLHRWRYAATPEPLGQPYLIDTDLRLAACGDWCLGSKVEAAFTSANALANAIQDIM